MKTTIFVCPFAQFGNPGTAAGAELVAEALEELLEDNAAEDRPHRARAYEGQIEIHELPLKSPGDFAKWRDRAHDTAHKALEAGHFLIWVGGNHLSVLPLYEVMSHRKQSLVVQLDAHLDVYNLRDCVTELSHGNFLRQLDPIPAIINLGHRDLFLPSDEIEKYYREVFSATGFIENEAAALTQVKNATKSAKEVLLDIDVDVFDPAYFPAVVDALPFGLTPQQVLKVHGAIENKKLTALAISEFDPGRDDNDRSLQLLIWLIEHVLLKRYEK